MDGNSESLRRGWIMEHRRKEAKKLATEIFDTIMDAEERASAAAERASKKRKEIERDIRNEHDAENRRLKERLRFSVAELNSEKELEAYRDFVKRHEPCRMGLRINGGKIPYVIQYGTGIGIATTVVCQVCGAKEDITDSSIW